MSEAEPIITIKEAAALLGIHPNTAYRLANDGGLPASKVGGSWRLSRADVEAIAGGGGLGLGHGSPGPSPSGSSNDGTAKK